MYNFDKYISDFLTSNKRMSAQGLGEFNIVNGQALNGAPLVEFTSNKNAVTSEELVNYVSENERKNKVVCGFDVEAYFNQVQQFINIGTPWVIPGYGQLQLGKSRELEFVQQVQGENQLNERFKRKQAAAEAHTQTFEPVPAENETSRKTGTVLLTLFIILALGAGGFYFYLKENKDPQEQTATDTAASITDTIVNVPPSSNMNNTVTATQPPVSTNTTTTASVPNQFKFILNRTGNTAYAIKRFNQLKSYGVKVFIDSSKNDNAAQYKIYLLQQVSPSDTARIKDSLTRYYGKPVVIE